MMSAACYNSSAPPLMSYPDTLYRFTPDCMLPLLDMLQFKVHSHSHFPQSKSFTLFYILNVFDKSVLNEMRLVCSYRGGKTVLALRQNKKCSYFFMLHVVKRQCQQQSMFFINFNISIQGSLKTKFIARTFIRVYRLWCSSAVM